MVTPTPTASIHTRASIVSRGLAALVGGYLLASLATVCLSHLLATTPAEAVLGASLFAFAIYTVAILWAFAVPSAGRAWRDLLVVSAVLAVPSLAFTLTGAPT